MNLVDLFFSFLGFLPWYVGLPPLIVIAVLWIINHFHFWTRLKLTERPFNKKQLSLLSVLILLVSILSSIPALFYSYQKDIVQRRRISELENALSRFAKGEATQEITSGIIEKLDCQDWDYCTNFRTDLGLNNKYYRHTGEDPQKLILEGGPFANPPLYFEKEIAPFYKFQLDVQPLNEEAANILIESSEIFQLFIGDNDYRSLAFLHWDQKESKWARGSDAKIYLERDLTVPDIEPKTQLSVRVETKSKGNKAEVEFIIIYKSIKGEKETAKFSRIVDLPAAEPEKFSTKVGTGMYRAGGNIPQAKFYFMGVRRK